MRDEQVASWWEEQGSPQYNYRTSNPEEEMQPFTEEKNKSIKENENFSNDRGNLSLQANKHVQLEPIPVALGVHSKQ